MQKIFTGVLLLIAFSVSVWTVVIAQDNQIQQTENNIQSLYVSNLILEDKDLSSGIDIKGTFDISNLSPYVISGAKYRVELVKIFEETYEQKNEDGTIDEIVYDEISAPFNVAEFSSPISVPSGQTETSFSYKIPENLPEGRIGLLVAMYTSDNVQASYDFVEIDVEGDRVYYLPAAVSVTIGSEESKKEIFSAFEGPRIGKDEIAQAEVIVLNEREATYTLNGSLKIFEGNNIGGKEVYSNKLESFKIAKGEKSFSYPLPLDLKSGVYTGLIEYFNDEDTSKTVPLEFRYIIDNNDLNPKIGEVSYNSTKLVDTNLLVSVSYIDTPLNFRKNVDGTYKDPRVQAFVESNKDTLIEDILNQESEGLSDVEIDQYFIEGLTADVKVIDFKSNRVLSSKNVAFENSSEGVADMGSIAGTDQIFVEVKLYQKGKLIDEYTDTVSVETYQYKNIFDKIWNQYKNIATTVILVALLLAIILIMRHPKVNKNVALSCVVAIILVSSSIIITKSAEAVSTSGFKHDPSYLSELKVDSPKPPDVEIYEPGDQIRFTANFNFMYCKNSGYNLNYRVSRPVLRGLEHAAMGGWQRLNQREFLNIRRDGSQKHVRYAAAINMPLQAPNQPGVYLFKYDVVATSGEWGDYENGQVVFRVARDVCKNLRGVQERVPAGYEAGRNRNGDPICTPKAGPVTLSCIPSKNKLEIGENVTYTARTLSNKNANFNWYEGRTTSASNLVKSQNNTPVSTYTTSYDLPGIYHTTALAFADGQSGQCTMVVSVGEEFWDDPALDDQNEEDNTIEEQFWIDDEGNKHLLDPNAPAGKIEFNMPNTLTNSTCKADWNAQHVLKCALYKGGTKVKNIGFTGNEDLTPGMYQIKCNQKRDGSEIKSEVRTCSLNPNFREN